MTDTMSLTRDIGAGSALCFLAFLDYVQTLTYYSRLCGTIFISKPLKRTKPSVPKQAGKEKVSVGSKKSADRKNLMFCLKFFQQS